MTSIWDDPELQTGDNYFTFEHVGDTLQGRIEIIKRQVWQDGSVSPQLFLTDPNGNEVVLSAGQIRLKNELVAQRPEPGDDIWIRLEKIEPRGGGKTLKHFDVRVRRNGAGPGYKPQLGNRVHAGQATPQQPQGYSQPYQQPGASQQIPGMMQNDPRLQQPPAQQPQYGYQQPPQGGPGPFQQGQQPGPAQQQVDPWTQPAAAQDPWAQPGQQQLPADDPWATQQQQPAVAGGEPPF